MNNEIKVNVGARAPIELLEQLIAKMRAFASCEFALNTKAQCPQKYFDGSDTFCRGCLIGLWANELESLLRAGLAQKDAPVSNIKENKK